MYSIDYLRIQLTNIIVKYHQCLNVILIQPMAWNITDTAFHELHELSDKVLQNIKKNYEETNELSDTDLLQLHSIFGDITEKALLLLETSEFVCLADENNSSKLFQVKGSSGRYYIIYPNINFCECSAFKYQVCKKDPDYLTCKHRLAAQLAEIVGKFKEESLSNSAFIKTMLSTVSDDCPL